MRNEKDFQTQLNALISHLNDLYEYFDKGVFKDSDEFQEKKEELKKAEKDYLGFLDYFRTGNNNSNARASAAINSPSFKKIFNSYKNGIAIGNESYSMGDYAIALGDNAISVNTSSIALGHLSKTANPISIDGMDINGTHYNFAGVANEKYGVVSIGRESERDEAHGEVEGIKRQLINLAAGRVSDDSTDGINGSQLNAVIKELSKLNTELTALKTKTPVIKAGDGLSLSEGDDGSITLSNALTFNAGNGITVNKTGNNVTITNSKAFEDADKEKLNTASTNATSALEKANTNEGAINTANGKITANEGKITDLSGKVTTVTNTANEALGKANTAVQPDKLKSGNGISIDKAENGDITVTNTKPFEDTDKEKLNTASTNANSALEKTNTNEGAINTANGKITANEGKITIQEGKINDLTPRVTANEGNITTLTGKVTTVTNTANEALGKANTNAETINNVSGVANEALGKANTAVQPEMLESGEGISINKKDGKVIISSTVTNNAGNNSGNGQPTNLIAGNGISVQPNENNSGTVITNTQAFTDADKEKLNSALQPNDLKAGSGITIENNTISNALSFEGESGIEVNREGNKVTIKGKPIVVNSLSVKTDQGEEKLKEKLEITGSDNIETETKNGKVIVKTKPVIKAKTLIADEMNIGGMVINSKQVNVGNKVVDGVANGEISENSQQAINGSQIFPIVNQVNVNTQEIHQLNGRVGNIEQRIGKMSKRYEAGLAGVAAMAGVPQVMGAGKRSLGVGVGTRPGANAVAVGYSASSDNGHHVIKTSFAVDTQRKLTGNAGYSYQW